MVSPIDWRTTRELSTKAIMVIAIPMRNSTTSMATT